MSGYTTYQPCAALHDKVALLYILDLPEYTGNASRQLITPDGCIELNILSGAPIVRTNAVGHQQVIDEPYVVSRFREHYFMQRQGPIKIVGIRFNAWSWQCFSKLRNIAPDIIAGAYNVFPEIPRLQRKLETCGHAEENIAVIEDYLLQHDSGCEQPIVAAVCRNLQRMQNTNGIDEVCKYYNISRRRLQQIFKVVTGISPKCYERMVRFQQSLNLLRDGEYEKLTDIAYINGYTDQSHFIKDFKRFSGINPLAYLQQNTVLNDLSATSFSEMTYSAI